VTETVTTTASTDRTGKPFLELKDLQVHFPTDDGLVKAVNGLSFTLERGKTLGIVGESGSGKSVSSLAIMGLHKCSRAKVTGEIWLDGAELVDMSIPEIRRLRGQQVAMIFQDPLSAMHPFYRVGDQLVEAYRVHNDVTKAVAKKRAVDLLDRVGIPSPDKRFYDYPHQFSGGMRQRAMIAMSLALDPELLIADEPTTALDVTVQAQIMDLLAEIQKERDMGMILITHDLGVVADVADRISVMYAGRIVEHADVYELFRAPGHPYTESLLESLPRVDLRGQELKTIKGLPPSLTNIPPGCPFNPRCPRVFDRCTTEVPAVHNLGMGRTSRCHIAEEVVARG
jgi:oligopeptide/dipeptide ABC transporter ATP-binding protein